MASRWIVRRDEDPDDSEEAFRRGQAAGLERGRALSRLEVERQVLV